MAIIKAFKGYRPAPGKEQEVAARPYDVLNTEEAREEAAGKPWSFLHISKPEIDLPDYTDPYSPAVYQKGRSNLDHFIQQGAFIRDEQDSMYIYRQNMNGHEQTGLVSCCHIDDYFNDVIKKHEYTRPKKEQDRIDHMAALEAHVGPVFNCYPDVAEIDIIINNYANNNAPTYDITTDDGIKHTLWVVSDAGINNELVRLFKEKVPYIYIADGHHRAASSAKVGQQRREEVAHYTGDEEFNYFLSVMFPATQLMIIDYNRVVTDLNGLSEDEFMGQLEENFTVSKANGQAKPEKNYDFGMYMDGQWYNLSAKDHCKHPNDPIKVLDVSVISDYLLDPVLGIKDQRTDDRIDFVGGIRGMKELEKRVNSGEMKVAFAIHPVSIQQLIDIADSGNVMPPKSTWFEPKLRSGLVIHTFRHENNTEDIKTMPSERTEH